MNNDTSTQDYQSSFDLQSETDIYESIIPINLDNLKTLNPRSEVLIYFENEFKKILEKNIPLIKQMCSRNQCSLNINYKEIEPLKDFLINNSNDFFKIFNKVLIQIVDKIYPNYKLIHQLLYIRIMYPIITEIKNLKSELFEKYLMIEGIVTKRTNIMKSIYKAIFICLKCNAIATEFEIENYFLYSIDNKENCYKKIIGQKRCEECQSGPFKLSKKSIYKNIQRFSLQEISNSKIPKSVDCILWGDLIDKIKPGMKIQLSGIFRVVRNNEKFKEIFLVNSINNEINIQLFNNNTIKEISLKPNLKELLIQSLAPHVFGLNKIKKSILCALFGGVSKTGVRGDINILLMGDPGTAKSQILRQIPNLVNRCILTSGQGASSVGLTATVKKEDNEWILEGGALVLADTGVCCIDEFDKMNSHDRVSIHEAMEQQSISISKAGIVTTLNARTTIIAAANSRFGNYNRALNFKNNTNLEDPIISRFDVINILIDDINSEKDIRTSNFVLKSHAEFSTRIHELNYEIEVETLPLNLLREYISYARTLTPKLNESGLKKISEVYVELRKGSKETSGLITVRNIESIIRLSESFARMRLSEYVNNSDINSAINVAVESFIDCQKYSLKKLYKKKFAKYLQVSKNELENLILFILNDMFTEKMKSSINSSSVSIKITDFQKRVSISGLDVSLKEILDLAIKEGYLIREKYISFNF